VSGESRASEKVERQEARVQALSPDPKFFGAMRYTYVIESGKDGQRYTGVTSDT
jgi:hypothetical protein